MIKTREFGQLPNGEVVTAFDFETEAGYRATILSYGATLQSLTFPNGIDVALGFGSLQGYLGRHPYFGAIIGRVANRISQAKFTLDGKSYSLPKTENGNSLHSGPEGFDRVNWVGEVKDDTLILRHTSPDGHQGFPGELMTELHFSFEGETLSLNIQAQTSKPCPVNITYHPYFNLTNGGATPCTDHQIQIFANYYTHMGTHNLPTGEISRTPTSAMERYNAMASIEINNTLDQNFVIKSPWGDEHKMRKMAKLSSDKTGFKVIVCSTQSCLQAYTGAGISEIIGKAGKIYGPNHGVTLEPQGFPDAVNHEKFPTNILRPGEVYNHTISYTFKSQ